jgi:hypothetical protein
MTRQPKKPTTKLPKSVEAWCAARDGVFVCFNDGSPMTWSMPSEAMPSGDPIRVRIVPVQPKKRRVRKEKK